MITLTRFGAENQLRPFAALIQNASASATKTCDDEPAVSFECSILLTSERPFVQLSFGVVRRNGRVFRDFLRSDYRKFKK